KIANDISDYESIDGYSLEELKEDGINWRERKKLFFNGAIHYLRTGLRKSEKRFGNRLLANTMFWNIAETVHPIAHNCTHGDGFEGQEFILTYTADYAKCRELTYLEYEGHL